MVFEYSQEEYLECPLFKNDEYYDEHKEYLEDVLYRLVPELFTDIDEANLTSEQKCQKTTR